MVYRLFFALLSVIIFLKPLPSKAEDVGIGYYGIDHSRARCDAVLGLLRSQTKPKLAVLYNTFAPDFSCTKKFLALPQPKVLEIHLANEVCSRNRRCGAYEFLRKYPVKRYNELLAKRDSQLILDLKNYWLPVRHMIDTNLSPFDVCILSPGLESNLGLEAAQVVIHEAQEFFSNRCKIAWPPVGSSATSARTLNATYSEGHGLVPKISKPAIVNLDGDVTSTQGQIDWAKKMKKVAEHVFLWLPCMNGIKPGPFVDPRKRDGFCSPAQLKEVKRMLNQSNK